MIADVLYPPLFLLVFATMWFAMPLLTARIGGWSSLAQHYRLEGEFAGERWRLCSGSLGWVSYGSCLTLGANAEAMFLGVLFPFRLAHPPLSIPWKEVSTEEYRLFFFPMVAFEFEREPSVRLKLSRELALKLAEASKGRLAIGSDNRAARFLD